MGRLLPAPSGQQIRSFYPAEYYGDAGKKFEPLVERLVRGMAARHARSLSRGLPAGSRILDVGCGRGVLLGAFADRGHRVAGFELSDTAAAGADKRAEIRTGAWLGEAAFDDSSFDLVVVWHVLEHVADPRQTLLEVARVAKPGAKLVVAVPNFSSWQAEWAGPAWFHLDLPRHLFHFPVTALRMLLTDCGFDCLQEKHFSLRQNPFGWIQSAMNRWTPLPRNSLYNLLHHRGPADTRPLGPAAGAALRAAGLAALPAALAASVLAAMLRRGATVCIVAQARKS